MYVWLWRRFPGGRLGRVACSLALFVAVCALLFFVVFPWAEASVPFLDVTVGG